MAELSTRDPLSRNRSFMGAPFMNVPDCARASRAAVVVLWDLSQVDPSRPVRPSLRALARLATSGYRQLDVPAPGTDPTDHGVVGWPCRRDWWRNPFCLSFKLVARRSSGRARSVARLSGPWSNVTHPRDAKIKSGLALRKRLARRPHRPVQSALRKSISQMPQPCWGVCLLLFEARPDTGDQPADST
jgi:hypothetical protein